MSASIVVSRAVSLLAIAAAALLASQLYANYVFAPLQMDYDETEHLHVVYSLLRGERPYIDFIENHPVLLHALLAPLLRWVEPATVMQLYLGAKAAVFLAFLGCCYLSYRLLADFAPALRLPVAAGALWLIAAGLFQHWAPANDMVWQLRPDWICYFLALAGLFLHYRVHARPVLLGRRSGFLLLALGGMLAGAGVAVMGKAIAVLVPYGFVALLWFAAWLARDPVESPVSMRRLLSGNAVFIVAFGISLALLVGLELALTGASLEHYGKANYVINRLVHPILSERQTDQITQLANLAGANLAFFVAAIVGVSWRTLVAFRVGDARTFRLLVMLCATVAFNCLMPAFSNGVTWPHYFMPALLAMWLIAAILTGELIAAALRGVEGAVRVAWAGRRVALPPLAGRGMLVVILGAIVAIMANRWHLAQGNLETVAVQRDLHRVLAPGEPSEFVADRLLPPDLTYLVFTPLGMPVRARHWGYYFLVGADKRFWVDMHHLGIAPDAGRWWPELYVREPPDAILVGEKSELESWMRKLHRAQGVDIGWLVAALESDYKCMHRKVVQVWVRSELAVRFRTDGWRYCN